MRRRGSSRLFHIFSLFLPLFSFLSPSADAKPDRVPLQTELHEPVERLDPAQRRDAVRVCAELATRDAVFELVLRPTSLPEVFEERERTLTSARGCQDRDVTCASL